MTCRLLLLSTEFPPGPGGIGTHAHQLAVHLAAAGWGVRVVSVQNHASDEEIVAFNASQPFAVHRLKTPAPLLLKAARSFRIVSRHVAEHRPDALVASGSRAVWLATLVGGRHRVPWLAVGHGAEFGSRRAWERRITQWAFGRATAVVCVSQYTWRQMERLGVRPRGGAVIPNGADPVRFQAAPAPPARTRTLLTIGNVGERKGQDVVIRALPAVLRRCPDVRYVMAGLPSRREPLERLAAELGVLDRIEFAGRVPQETLARLLNACDVFVMTSRHTASGDFEGYGIAVVEAALCGKPAVVTGSAGLAEAIVDGETGIAVPEDDPAATAAAIVRLLEDDALRRRMGEAARARALATQTWAHRVRAYDELLRSLARRRA